MKPMNKFSSYFSAIKIEQFDFSDPSYHKSKGWETSTCVVSKNSFEKCTRSESSKAIFCGFYFAHLNK